MDDPASVTWQEEKDLVKCFRDTNVELSGMKCLVAVRQEQLVHVGILQDRESGVQKLEGGNDTRRSSGKKDVKSSVRTSRKRPTFDRPFVSFYLPSSDPSMKVPILALEAFEGSDGIKSSYAVDLAKIWVA